MPTQPLIAVVFDCDRTLSPVYMQQPVLKRYGVDEKDFWREVEDRRARFKQAGQRASWELVYLNAILDRVREGPMAGLSNAVLRECGAGLPLFPGLPDFLPRLKGSLEHEPRYRQHRIEVEYYIVSSGLAEVIRGSPLAPHFTDVFACEFGERNGVISEIIHYMSPTEKTRPLFEISKGSSELTDARVRPEQRRIPFEHMIYVGDGPSDIPALSVIEDHGGIGLAVYDPDVPESFESAMRLLKGDRVLTFGPADYRPGSHTTCLIEYQVRCIADGIVADREAALREGVVEAVRH